MFVSRKKQKTLDLVERVMVRWGYTHTEGRVYALLLLSDRSLTIEDLADMTELSRSSISSSLSRLSKDYLVTVKKHGRVKFFSPVPAFLETFLEQPRDLLEKEIKPLKEITERFIKKAETEEYRTRLEDLMRDLENLECVLQRIIEIESRTECANH